MITSPSNELVIPTVTFYCRPITSDGRGSRPLIMKFTTVSNLSRFSGGREDIFIVRRGNSCPSRSLIRASTFTAAKSVSTLNALQCLVSWSYVYDLALQDKQLSGQIEEGREEQCFGAFLFFRLHCWGSTARRAKKMLTIEFPFFSSSPPKMGFPFAFACRSATDGDRAGIHSPGKKCKVLDTPLARRGARQTDRLVWNREWWCRYNTN